MTLRILNEYRLTTRNPRSPYKEEHTMDIQLEDERTLTGAGVYQLALSALSALPDHSATDMSELALRIGVDKLELITWIRSDIRFARLIASKVTK